MSNSGAPRHLKSHDTGGMRGMACTGTMSAPGFVGNALLGDGAVRSMRHSVVRRRPRFYATVEGGRKEGLPRVQPVTGSGREGKDFNLDFKGEGNTHGLGGDLASGEVAIEDSANGEAREVEHVEKEGLVEFSLFGRELAIPARWLLYSVPFLWGSFGPSVRLLFAQNPHPDPSVFNTERLMLSALVYVPVLFAEISAFRGSRSDSADEKLGELAPEGRFGFLKAGLELGVYVFLANVAQVVGLQQTSASRAAFLVQLQTVIVPVLAGLFGLNQISRKTWISSMVAVAGVALLSSDKGHGTASSLTGDALEITSALFFSTYIIRLGEYCNKVASGPLVATKIAVQAILSFGWAAGVELSLNYGPGAASAASTGDSAVVEWTTATILVNVFVVAWTGLASSALSGWVQTKGQQAVPASDAVVIFATQPLWASALAALILGESFGPKGFAGGAMIIAATLLASQTDGDEDGKEDGTDAR